MIRLALQNGQGRTICPPMEREPGHVGNDRIIWPDEDAVRCQVNAQLTAPAAERDIVRREIDLGLATCDGGAQPVGETICAVHALANRRAPALIPGCTP